MLEYLDGVGNWYYMGQIICLGIIGSSTITAIGIVSVAVIDKIKSHKNNKK